MKESRSGGFQRKIPLHRPFYKKHPMGNCGTYRLAVAATGEYTDFHGGTVGDGIAAIVTAMNRVNGVYERDLAIRMTLIANNDLIVFTDGATDPFSNVSAGNFNK